MLIGMNGKANTTHTNQTKPLSFQDLAGTPRPSGGAEPAHEKTLRLRHEARLEARRDPILAAIRANPHLAVAEPTIESVTDYSVLFRDGAKTYAAQYKYDTGNSQVTLSAPQPVNHRNA